mmetsp:Transcript_4100/g.5383  ORF Transcript_4100/g.5383 Transcript_4100/m.5383 type:complete len:446 (-) Transcript_4100:185-1522(-)|eukprot:CAMPEP_0198146952 /NCGR_PEP_ID=MMETSP1443-20131203/32446_1 /TAXON_ID=186043 /ORGANISM="Entomoneis sp., Strain CCMP2396" /LENGTH=445 /DNA_ID=CAMNT_0043811071 /DNA_START=66 /DNA_END=1403 /DNA_ORIENTATION=-
MTMAKEEHQDEFDEAVTQALDWFEARRVSNKKRLFLDFRQLIIGHGIDVEKMAAKIRERVSNDVQIHLSLKCCRIEDGGLQVLKHFLRNVPNLTFINVTFLWFDYDEISNVVLSASNLRALELPLGSTPGISNVLRACGDQVEDLRFFSGGSFLSRNVLHEATASASLEPLHNLKSLSFTSFKCDNDCMDLFVSDMLGLQNNLEQLHIACDGGTMTSKSLPVLAKLLRNLSSSIKLSLRIADNPDLFQNATRDQSQDFMEALQQSNSLGSLDLEHVGLTGDLTKRLFHTLEFLQGESVRISIGGSNIFRGTSTFDQLSKSIPRMRGVSCLAVIDTVGSVELNDECGSVVAKAVHRNASLKHLTLQMGGDFIYLPILDELFERNESIDHALKLISHTATTQLPFSSGLWVPALIKAQTKAGDFCADPIYHMLHHMVTSHAFDQTRA